MTLFAGAFSRHRDQSIPDSVCEDLRRAISRDQADKPLTFRDSRCFIANVDIGALMASALLSDHDGSVSVFAGEPLVENGLEIPSQDRSKELEALHQSWKIEDWSIVSRARGVFSAAHYQPDKGKLFLISDKMCIRPLYFWTDERFVIFATALRVLEALEVVLKVMDLRGVTEMCGLGYPLGSRTPYHGISLLNAAEIVRADHSAITRDRYWRWDQIEPSRRTQDEQLKDLHASFTRAVAIRKGESKSAVAYLSGGLDSRCVVAALLDQDARVHTFNFALPGTQDYIFGNDFAAQARTIHKAVPKEHGDLTPDYSTLLSRAWRAAPSIEINPFERAFIAWSGEGGSVALGHVHLGVEIVERMRAREDDRAVEAFLLQEQASVTRRLLTPDVGSHLVNALHIGIREELMQFECADLARSFYLFLLLNDQRRKLTEHFENIDLHRLEFQLPFFDSDFLAIIISLPLDKCLRHEFYLEWLKCFSPLVTKVPWQSYPGHNPCPLEVKQDAAYQWDSAYQLDQATALKSELLAQADEMLGAVDFPKEILSKRYLSFAALIYKYGLRDYSYVIQAGWKYYFYWVRCGGEYFLPSPAEVSNSTSRDSVRNRLGAESELSSSAIK